ncbi:MAG TPA: agmatine deiminase family protein [Gemmatimonadaceae bacterium]|nr:agmatine deiminase family protein [Gemmatimonadaceae bacterium]
MAPPTYRMPAEWEPHRATWIAWPHHEPDWPGKFEPIPWAYAEIVRVLHTREQVEILCQDEHTLADARAKLASHGVDPARVRLHVVPTDRVWLRDSAPTGVIRDDGKRAWANWRFNGWAKYNNYERDEKVGEAIAGIADWPRLTPTRPDNGARVVLEGGAIDTNGAGLLLTTEECLLSSVQERNPGLTREGYEQVFREILGVRQTIWLGGGCAGDDTHGHVDDIARFVGPDTVVLAVEEDPSDANYIPSMDNLERLERLEGRNLKIVRIPFPRPVIMDGQRLPASYANFYIGNGVVLVPTFNDRNDRHALHTLATCFPDRDVIGINAVDLIWGLGAIHCLTQQEPA